MYNGQYHVVGEKTRTIQYVITVNGSVSDVLKNQPIQSLEFVKKEGQDVVIEQDSKNYYLKVTLVPAYATVESMKWSSSDESVASVDDGIVSFHKAGVVELKVVVNGRYEAKLPLTITPMCIGENAVYLIFDRTDMDLVLWDGIDRYRSTRYKKDEDYTLDIEEIEDELKVTVKGINLLCDEGFFEKRLTLINQMIFRIFVMFIVGMKERN